jgi:Recombination endonuclease VII
MEKVCTKCGISKIAEQDFYLKGGYYSSPCKECRYKQTKEYQTRWQRENKDKIRAAYRRMKNKNPSFIREQQLRKFNLDLAGFKRILARQNNSCAICKRDRPDGRGSWHVDHDHDCCPGERSCGKCVRGLLCMRCNFLLGYSKEDQSILDNAKEYLIRHAKSSETIAGDEGQAGDVLEQVPISG